MRSLLLALCIVFSASTAQAVEETTCEESASFTVPAIAAATVAAITAVSLPIFTPLTAALTFGLAETLVGVDSQDITDHALWGAIGSGVVGGLVLLSAVIVGGASLGMVAIGIGIDDGFKNATDKPASLFTTTTAFVAMGTFLITPFVHAAAQALWWGFAFPASRANAEDRACSK